LRAVLRPPPKLHVRFSRMKCAPAHFCRVFLAEKLVTLLQLLLAVGVAEEAVVEEARIRLMGENFAEIWGSGRCPATLKKMIFRTAIEEIIVREEKQNKTLQFTIHWSGGTHTQLEMERPRPATEMTTPTDDLQRWAGASLLAHFDWLGYLFGAFLALTGLKLLTSAHRLHPEANPLFRVLRKVIPVINTDADQFFVRSNSRLLATPLFLRVPEILAG